MKNIISIGALLVIILTLTACKKEEPLTPTQLIEGRWTIQSQEILTLVIENDGSYLKFNSCSGACSGEDYKASDSTTGTFTYSINTEGTILTIDDPSEDGGNWSATWDVLELTENDFRITATTLLGNLRVTMTK